MTKKEKKETSGIQTFKTEEEAIEFAIPLIKQYWIVQICVTSLGVWGVNWWTQ